MPIFRHILHIHIPAFSIAVEQVCHPELKDRPVVVVPPHSERALILSVSSKARNEGVYKGMSLTTALKFCPDLTVVPPNPDLIKKASQELNRIAAQYTPLWEPFRPGHLYMDVTGTKRLWGRAKDTASRLRQEIRTRLHLAGAVGVAGNKMVSSIASRIMRSEGVMDVNHGQEPSFMAPLKVNILPGIGHVRRRILLEELNISLVREIASMDMGRLKLLFGRQALVIHQRALGIDPTPVYSPRIKPTIAEEITLSKDENDDHQLLGILYGLLEKCAHRLRGRASFPRKIGLLLRYTDQVEIIRQVKLPSLSLWDFDLYKPLEEAFYKACQRRMRIRFMRVWFQDFLPVHPQLSLFTKTAFDIEKMSLVTLALDRIREKHGHEAIRYGRAV
jgi:DNA polymerase-4